MTSYTIAGFNLPHVHEEDKLCRMLSLALKCRLGKPHPQPLSLKERGAAGGERLIYWDAGYFSLDKVKVFRDSTAEEQAEILHLCSCGLLEEAYLIEKAGVGYMAKMVTLAETTEEQMLYALFSSDEVTHLVQISRFLPTQIVGTNNPFLRLLGDLVETQDKTVLLFVLQVVLEGWGLNHYRSLAKECQNLDLGSVLWGFLQDESRHHGTGVTLFDRMAVAKSSQEMMIETLALFLQMVQVGPQSVVAVIEKVKGHLSRLQKVQVFEELDTETHSGSRLVLLRSLMRNPNAGIIVEELEARGAFQPWTAEKCVFSN